MKKTKAIMSKRRIICYLVALVIVLNIFSTYENKNMIIVNAADTYSEWSVNKPAAGDYTIETKTQYSSATRTMDWQEIERGSIEYGSNWNGFDKNNALYIKYNKVPLSAYEDTDNKVVVNDYQIGYLYFHWCEGTNYNTPQNRYIKSYKQNGYATFHAFYSTENIGFNAKANAFDRSYPAVCKCTYWWLQERITIRRCDYVKYVKAQVGEYGEWSEWSDNVIDSTDVTKVRTRKLYRIVYKSKNSNTNDKVNLLLSKSVFVYNGKSQKPGVTVKSGSKKLEAGKDYMVTYSTGSKNVGTYNATIVLRGKYKGSATASYVINPKGTKITKLTKLRNVYTFIWKKQTKQVTGYEFQYSTNKSFTSGKETKTFKIKKASKNKQKVKKLKSGKKYYLRIRSYKTVKKKKYYSSWSGIQSFKAR